MELVVDDPVLARRARIEKLADLGQRIGYGLLAVAVVAFVVGFATGFGALVRALVIGGLLGMTVTLAPAIVLGYAVKAAAREDRERGAR
jgi:ABC-type transport system involved in cytochrome bd biosynthesis fused ATPase/permease subunit